MKLDAPRPPPGDDRPPTGSGKPVAARRFLQRAGPLSILGVALVALPFAMRAIGMTESLATEIALFALTALAFNLLLGYTGLLSFGHGLFFGFAAYAGALSQIHWFPGSFVWPLAFAIASTSLLGLVVGFLVLRRRGVYFSLLTLAFTALAFFIAYRWTDFTGGESGLRGVTRTTLAGVDLDNQFAFYALTALTVFAAAWVLLRIVRSPFGSVLVAIRENEQRARFAGYAVQRYKLAAFTISAAVVGLGGCLAAGEDFVVHLLDVDPFGPQRVEYAGQHAHPV
jgi:ABC-type branched-subunit amino acid transport system permease subunit